MTNIALNALPPCRCAGQRCAHTAQMLQPSMESAVTALRRNADQVPFCESTSHNMQSSIQDSKTRTERKDVPG